MALQSPSTTGFSFQVAVNSSATITSADATLRQDVLPPIGSKRSEQSCLVQIYPPDVVDGMVLIEKDRLEIGRDTHADFVLADASVSRRHAEIIRTDNGSAIRDLGSTNGILVNDRPVHEATLNSGDTVRIGSFLFKYLSAGSIESQYHETVYSALTRDALTGAMNKRFFLESLHREMARAIRQKCTLCLLMLDIDHFKKVNDTHGHLAGDEVLREFGARILNVCREDDMLARYGGEEFCLVLSGMNHEYGLEMAERCRVVIANTPFDTTVGPLPVTASFGMEYFDGADAASILSSPTKLLERADKRLYEAKNSGRNRVCG